MGFFNRIFGYSYTEEPQPDISFGRYSDSYKTDKQYQHWDLALANFEQKKYKDCYLHFFEFLKDENEQNLKYWPEDQDIRFELYQGSKRITGKANAESFKAQAKIAKADPLNVDFMRRLMEQNFNLKYSRFSIDQDNHLTIIFDTHSLDGSPYKLYHALKELAINADKQDDLLIDEFQYLEPVDIQHLIALSADEKNLKYDYIIAEINRTLSIIDEGPLKVDQHAAGFAYLLLNLIYKLDYLIKPEGYMMEALERANRHYFASDQLPTKVKINHLKEELLKIVSRPKQTMAKEMYRVICTFGITNPANHNRVVSLINTDLINMDWYEKNGHLDIAQAIPGYIVGYCMFNYAIPKPVRDLFHLYFKITESKFFQKLGFTTLFYEPDHQKFNKRTIRKAIDHIESNNRNIFPKFHPNFQELVFDNLLSFSRSYLTMIKHLDLTKAD